MTFLVKIDSLKYGFLPKVCARKSGQSGILSLRQKGEKGAHKLDLVLADIVGVGDLDLFEGLEGLLVDGVDKRRGGAAVVERGGPEVRDLGREFGALAEDGSLLRELELVCLAAMRVSVHYRVLRSRFTCNVEARYLREEQQLGRRASWRERLAGFVVGLGSCRDAVHTASVHVL